MALSAVLPEQLGVMVWGHSRLDHAVWGSDQDSAQWDAVWAVLSPRRDRATASENHVRDAMHVWTSIRYGANAFVTLDGSGKKKGLLDRAQAVSAAFDGFAVMTPVQARDFACRLLRRRNIRLVLE